MSTIDWRSPTTAAWASKRADCGHRIFALVYLRIETVGHKREAHTLCNQCSTPDDYAYSPGGPDTSPWRIQHL